MTFCFGVYIFKSMGLPFQGIVRERVLQHTRAKEFLAVLGYLGLKISTVKVKAADCG
jgi:hypothetical protein